MNNTPNDAIIKAAQEFLVHVTDFPQKEMGGLLVNRVDFWKFRNTLSMVTVAKNAIEQNGNQFEKIVPDVLIPLLEESGKREDLNILKMFSSLLFAHLHPSTSKQVHSSYTFVLAQLSHLDVHIVDAMFAGISSKGFEHRSKCFSQTTVMNLFNLPKETVILCFQNLWRLGICDKGDDGILPMAENQIVFTDYGWNFMRACNFISASK